MNFKDYYSTLGILPQATQEEVRIAYKTMAKKWHPDANKGINTTGQMQLIAEAYEILKNTEKRKTYNIEYFRYFQTRLSNQPNEQIKIEKCFYCDKNIANKKFSHKQTFYKETNRTRFPQRKVWYKTAIVEIPRCEECFNTHKSGARIFLLLPLFAFTILGLILGLTIWSMWFLCLLGGGLTGVIIGWILSSIDDSIIAKEAGIKKESDFDNFPLVRVLYKEGWSTNQPTA